MAARRYLCSQLVRLTWSGGERVVNLEEIWENGAVLESEEPLHAGVRAEVRAGSCFFAGRVATVGAYEFGWRIELEFSPLTPWSPERFRPDHLLDLWELGETKDPNGSP